jgi:cytidyltransferase-like protein
MMAHEGGAKSHWGQGQASGTPALPFAGDGFLKPLYGTAVISTSRASQHGVLCRSKLGHTLKLAAQVIILIFDDDYHGQLGKEPAQSAATIKMEKLIADLGYADRVQAKLIGGTLDAEDYFGDGPGPELVLAEQADFHQFDRWNERRKKAGHKGYDILYHMAGGVMSDPAAPAPLRAFRLASIGGTFNALHEGHKEYIKSALRLADGVHVLIADDDYAAGRKTYAPKSFTNRSSYLRKYVSKELGCAGRLKTARLSAVADIEKYVRTEHALDLVVTERAYFDWFEKWNMARRENGLPCYSILCRERTIVQGADLSSSMLAEPEPKPVDQESLFRA